MLFARLVGGDEEVGVGVLAFFEPRDRLVERATHALAEVPGADRGHVLHETEQVRPGRHEWATHVVLRQSVELPEQSLAPGDQVTVERGLRVPGRHGHPGCHLDSSPASGFSSTSTLPTAP